MTSVDAASRVPTIDAALRLPTIDAALRLPRASFVLDVALKLPARGVSALFGPSGCGKTSVLRALSGLERAAGHVRLDEHDVWQDDARGVFVPTHRRPVGYVIQEAALFPHLDVRANLVYGQRRIAPQSRRIALEHVVELLGIDALMARRPDTLSGGERQRVAIARALATSPRLLLMDEPLAALDAARKAEVLPYLERLNAELSIPIVLVSHAVDEVARLADHVVLMEQGRVVADGPLAEVMARLDLPTARGDGAGVVHRALVMQRDPAWQLARLRVGTADNGFDVWAPDHGLAEGSGARVRVLARDVSVSRERLDGSSIGNQLAATVEAIADDEHPGLALVRVRVGGDDQALHASSPSMSLGTGLPVVARLTRRSAHALDLAPGQPVWVHVKTVALMA
jgi:molybdate transport system ATP-binding protein